MQIEICYQTLFNLSIAFSGGFTAMNASRVRASALVKVRLSRNDHPNSYLGRHFDPKQSRQRINARLSV